MCHAVLAAVSGCCSPRIGRLLTRYSPVRHSVISLPPRRTSQKCFVRLECVKHAASVHPEPGSNSLKNLYIPGQSLLCPLIPSSELILASFPKSTVQSFSTRSFFVLSLLFNFQGPEIFFRSFVVVQFPRTKRRPVCSPPRSGSIILSHPIPLCQPLFLLFSHFFSVYSS